MNIYAFIPLIATIAYIPLIAATASARPWTRQHLLFFGFLVAAIFWSLSDYIFRSGFVPEYNYVIIRCVILGALWMSVQFHVFTSSFFPRDKGRWLPFAYGALLINIVLAILGYLPRGVIAAGDTYYADYGIGIVCTAIPLVILLARNVYIFVPRLKNHQDPVVHNQVISLLVCLGVLTIFLASTLTPINFENRRQTPHR